MNAEGKAKADKLRAESKRHFKLQAREDKIQTLRGLKANGTQELKRMRDVRYSTDPAPSAGQYWNPEGKRHARGSEGKARNILKGNTARKNQAKGL